MKWELIKVLVYVEPRINSLWSNMIDTRVCVSLLSPQKMRVGNKIGINYANQLIGRSH